MKRRRFLKHSLVLFSLACTPLCYAAERNGTRTDPARMDDHIKDRLNKTRLFDHTFDDDVFLDANDIAVLNSSLTRLKKVQSIVGYGNFNLLSLDEAIRISKNYSNVEPFSKTELAFLERIFYSRVKEYGFMGEKPIKTITGKIPRKKVKKIPYTGNFLYRGKPMEMYARIKKQIGNDVILTSGVRSVMKQFLLFLNKARNSQGNLSMASRSLAPPGYSFHGVGDFDVGKIGFGVHNFTERFTETDVYKKLTDLGYIKFRYNKDNHLGVRFEPWHVEVV